MPVTLSLSFRPSRLHTVDLSGSSSPSPSSRSSTTQTTGSLLATGAGISKAHSPIFKITKFFLKQHTPTPLRLSQEQENAGKTECHSSWVLFGPFLKGTAERCFSS